MMRNRATAGRIGLVIWVVMAVVGDIALALAPIPPGQASNLASDESEVIRILAMAGWPIFFGVVMGLYFMLFLNRVAPSEREAPSEELRGNARLQTTWIVTTVILVLVLATYGTIELANEEPGAGISTVSTPLSLPTNPSQPLEVQVIRSSGGSRTDIRHTVESKLRNSCCRLDRRFSSMSPPST